MEEVTAEEFSGGEEKVTDNLEQNIVGRLEQMIELTKEIEESKAEYRMVTAYFNDIELIAKAVRRRSTNSWKRSRSMSCS